jgi:hypothetical protein
MDFSPMIRSRRPHQAQKQACRQVCHAVALLTRNDHFGARFRERFRSLTAGGGPRKFVLIGGVTPLNGGTSGGRSVGFRNRSVTEIGAESNPVLLA